MTDEDRHRDRPSPRDLAARILARWARDIGREGEATLDENGQAMIAMANQVGLAIEVIDEERQLLVTAPVAPMPEDPEARFGALQDSLRFNLAQQIRGGGAFGLDADGGLLIYGTATSIDTADSVRLGAMVEAAYSAVLDMREWLGFDPTRDLRPDADEDAGASDEELLRV